MKYLPAPRSFWQPLSCQSSTLGRKRRATRTYPPNHPLFDPSHLAPSLAPETSLSRDSYCPIPRASTTSQRQPRELLPSRARRPDHGAARLGRRAIASRARRGEPRRGEPRLGSRLRDPGSPRARGGPSASRLPPPPLGTTHRASPPLSQPRLCPMPSMPSYFVSLEAISFPLIALPAAGRCSRSPAAPETTPRCP